MKYEKFEGKVVKVLEDKFIAHLFKPNTEPTESIEGEFDFDSVSIIDRHLIKEGMIFYWYVADDTSRHNDFLMVRRIPSWKEFDIDTPDPEADNFFNFE